VNDRFKHPVRSFRERHGRFYVYPLMERFEARDTERRCFTRAGANRRRNQLNTERDTIVYMIGYWSVDGREGWYPFWLEFWDKLYDSVGLRSPFR
jgi:hypothetical protein